METEVFVWVFYSTLTFVIASVFTFHVKVLSLCEEHYCWTGNQSTLSGGVAIFQIKIQWK